MATVTDNGILMSKLRALVWLGILVMHGGSHVAFALDFGIERVASGLDHPLYVTQAPGDTELLYVLEQRIDGSTTGRISTVNAMTGARETFLTISGLDNKTGFDDGGLHTLAFHPDFQQNGKFYVSWVDGQSQSRVDEFTLDDGTPVMSSDPILSYPQLHSRAGRHSIGWIGFKPGAIGAERNHLYVTTGDGGFSEGSESYVNVAQDLGTPYGKVLRLEVGTGTDAYPSDANKNFGIPENNPFIDDENALGEVLHSGLRNPWRVSFDRDTGDMILGDVGWLTREEINFIKDGQSGLDFGWSSREGTIEVPGGNSPDIGGPLGDSINPIHEYERTAGRSVASGYVYRGPVEAAQGSYFFADSFSGRVWSSSFDRDTDPSMFDGMNLANVTEITSDLQETLVEGILTNIVSFGEDNLGNLYLVKIGEGGTAGSVSNTGELFRLIPKRIQGDLNSDSKVDIEDWQLFLLGHGGDFSGMSFEEAYALGDLDADFDNDIYDFRLFQNAYEAIHGLGSLESIPEPSSICVMLPSLVLFAAFGRRSKSNGKRYRYS